VGYVEWPHEEGRCPETLTLTLMVFDEHHVQSGEHVWKSHEGAGRTLAVSLTTLLICKQSQCLEHDRGLSRQHTRPARLLLKL